MAAHSASVERAADGEAPIEREVEDAIHLPRQPGRQLGFRLGQRGGRIGMDRDGGVAEHRLGAGRGDRHVLRLAGARVDHRVVEVPEEAGHRLVEHFVVADRGLQKRVPIHQSLAAKNQAILKHFEEGLPPMSAGIFGYLGYDMVRQMERLPEPNADALGVPDAILARPTVMVIFDSVKDEITVVTPVRPKPGISARAAYEAALDRIEATSSALEAPLPATLPAPLDLSTIEHGLSNTSESEFLGMVERAKDYIRAGDIFQVVLSQRFEAPFTLPPLTVFGVKSLTETLRFPFALPLFFFIVSPFFVFC
mgnify:CR=1 FL=1